MIVIGLSGFAGAGKSTVAEYLVREYGFTRLSFATAVKDVVAATFGWDRARLEGMTPDDRQWRDEPDEFWSTRMGRPFTPRYALQYVGTDVFRTHVLPSIWSDIVISKIQRMRGDALVVIDDVRFVNERTALRGVHAHFAIVQRQQFPSADHQRLWTALQQHQPLPDTTIHLSEWDWLQDATVATDPLIVNRGSYDELYHNIDLWYNQVLDQFQHSYGRKRG